MSQCKQNNQQNAGIGCFGVIIIGLMIFFIGRWSNEPVREDLAALSAQVTELTEQHAAMQTELNEFRYEVRTAIAAD